MGGGARARGRGAEEEEGRGKRKETLAEFSERTVKRKLLRRRRGRRKEEEGTGGHEQEQGVVEVGVCGTRAKAKGERGREGEEGEEAEGAVEWEDIGGENEEEDGDGDGDVELGDAKDLVVDVDVDVDVTDPLADHGFVRVWASLVHRSHILCLLCRGQHCDGVASDAVLQAKVLSLVPRWLLPDPALLEQRAFTAARLVPLTTFFCKRFKCSAGGAVGEGLSMRERLAVCFDADPFLGGQEDVSVLFAALCRSLGLQTRLVRVVDPVAKTPKKALEAYRASQRNPRAGDDNGDGGGSEDVQVVEDDEVTVVVDNTKKGRAKGGKRSYGEWNLCDAKEVKTKGKKAGNGQRNRESGASSSSSSTRFWVEVCFHTPEGMVWESVDPVCGLSGDAGKYKRDGGLCIAFRKGRWKDVTQRYASDYHGSRRAIDWKWWQDTSFGLQCNEEEELGREGQNGQKGEDALLEERVVAQMKANWPKTLAAAKVHPYYVLHRHLRKNQALQPKPTFLGKFIGGEPLYLRSEVQDLRTRTGWERQGRKVREEEIPKPAKESSPANGSGGRKPPVLYGEWQTDRIVLEEGVIPRNSYGNVLVPPMVKQLPPGLSHLAVPPFICRALKKDGKIADFAEAVAGFDQSYGGARRPKLEGVVVLEQDQAAVVDSFLDWQFERAAAARRKRLLSGERTWRKLLRTLIKRKELREAYVLPKPGATPPVTASTSKADVVVVVGGAKAEIEEL
ncbi:DNA repair protein Rad4 [Chloropicon primus]|uniref:DNA repair protein Rad4 n=1 Tax=Chloropicon primus TaxID=1764295 RepID=A0A5B8MMA3_9CHLO|nr:DNA repair protein Rad4 [Chloropicon primus]UPQ99639.1 DNA repair protein Rad4 [Chloropicon primus]|eukprot:QDZ20430.1 DNA repair protein Rad4 [Chloropicon primus]